MMYHLFIEQAQSVLAQVPDFGTGAPPPGSEKLLTIGRWVLWIASGLCVIGMFLIGGKLAIQHSHGEMQQHGKALGSALLGCILVGASTGIAAALI